MSGAPSTARAPREQVGFLVEEGPADVERRKRLTEREEEERPDEQLAIPLFGRPLVIGGELESKLEFEADTALGSDDDDRARLSPSVELEIFYPPLESVAVFAEVKYRYPWEFYREGGGSRGGRHLLQRGESWIHATDPWEAGLGVQVGRQRFRDETRWWWDENLDAVRLFYEDRRLEAELAVAEELLPDDLLDRTLDPEQRDVLRLLASASWRYTRRHRLELFALHQLDHSRTESPGRQVAEEREDEIDADLTWVGLRSRGRWSTGEFGKLHYWAGVAGVVGDETEIDYDEEGPDESVVAAVDRRDVWGWAVDGGLTWETALPARPSLTLGYALGSGDSDPDDGGTFRQTGLHRNDAKFRGVDAFRFYGEILDPELSNLHVATGAIGLRLTDSDSVELVYHYYRLLHAAGGLRHNGIDASPDGGSASIGHELDLVIGIESWEHRRIEIVGSAFRAGKAYGERSGEFAFLAALKFEIAF